MQLLDVDLRHARADDHLERAQSYFVNEALAKARYGNADKMNFEAPLTQLVWVTSIVSVLFTFAASYLLIPILGGRRLAVVEALGSSSRAARSPARSSPSSSRSSPRPRARTCARSSPRRSEGGASLNILSGLMAGNFSAFWMGIVIMALMGAAYFVSQMGLGATMTIGGDGRLAGLRVRPRGLRLPRHGPGHPRGRLATAR